MVLLYVGESDEDDIVEVADAVMGVNVKDACEEVEME